jgi:hypothetical protein
MLFHLERIPLLGKDKANQNRRRISTVRNSKDLETFVELWSDVGINKQKADDHKTTRIPVVNT